MVSPTCSYNYLCIIESRVNSWKSGKFIPDILQYLEKILPSAFDLLNKMRYILWVVALLQACDVTNNGHHFGFYQELEIWLKLREIFFNFFVLDMKTTYK